MEFGKCHICKLHTEIAYCSKCGHHFCESCRSAWFSRGLEWVKELVGGRRDGCCGPDTDMRGDAR
jgi:hypothetical protein